MLFLFPSEMFLLKILNSKEIFCHRPQGASDFKMFKTLYKELNYMCYKV